VTVCPKQLQIDTTDIFVHLAPGTEFPIIETTTTWQVDVFTTFFKRSSAFGGLPVAIKLELGSALETLNQRFPKSQLYALGSNKKALHELLTEDQITKRNAHIGVISAEQETQSSKRQKIMGVIDQHHLNGGLTRTQRAVWCAHLLDEANGTSLESVLGAQEKWKLPPGLVGKSDRKSQSPSVKREEGEPTEDVPTHTTTETTGDVQVTFVNSMGIATQTISLCQVRLLRNFC